MVEILDTKTFSISVITHGAVIENLVYPTQVEIGEAFQVAYDCMNTGNTMETLFGQLKDTDGNIIPGSEWQEEVNAGATVSKTIDFLDGIQTSMEYTLEVGRP